ncbi:hypothetical protein T492DRAFT_853129 [Pavlovales sp. CCMP2436]|nr:hypothetical protein T492DRAFT_853129 [Pavlovales sp. CCMP2436]
MTAVHAWLELQGLSQYAASAVEAGFDNVEVITAIDKTGFDALVKAITMLPAGPRRQTAPLTARSPADLSRAETQLAETQLPEAPRDKFTLAQVEPIRHVAQSAGLAQMYGSGMPGVVGALPDALPDAVSDALPYTLQGDGAIPYRSKPEGASSGPFAERPSARAVCVCSERARVRMSLAWPRATITPSSLRMSPRSVLRASSAR